MSKIKAGPRPADSKTGGYSRQEHDRRVLAEARLAAYITAVVAAAPPLRPEQRERLALLLGGTP
jgi:hypothetical protein